MAEIEARLSPQTLEQLQKVAGQRGISAEQLAAEIVRDELSLRTKPRRANGVCDPI